MKYTLQLANPTRSTSNLNFTKSFKTEAGKYKSLRASTGISVPTQCWDQKGQKLFKLEEGFTKDEQNTLNKRVAEFNAFMAKAETSADMDDIHLGYNEVKGLIELYRTGDYKPKAAGEAPQNQLDLIQYCEQFIPQAINRRSKFARKNERITKTTVQQYTQLLPLLQHFHYFTGADMDLRAIDVSWHDKFIQWGVDVEKYGLQTMGKHIKSIKRLAYYAKIDGLEINSAIQQDEDFDKPTSEADDTQYFTEEELGRIQSLDLSDNKRLELERDRLIIGCYTGLRVSDLSRLHISMVRENSRGRKRIYITPEKTKKSRSKGEIAIPVLKPVQDILDARNGFPKFTNDQAFNKAMKKVAELAGMTKLIRAGRQEKVQIERKDESGRTYITEVIRKVEGEHPKHQLMSTHSCRRSFASNMYGVMPNQHIMAITGHKKEEDFLLYIRVTADEHADKFEQFYDAEMQRRGI